MIKVFLSHQSADATTAAYVARRLKNLHDIDSYLDVIDPYIGRPGEDLAAHIRAQMGKCTQLLAVVSEATKGSQWVPWEIGVATVHLQSSFDRQLHLQFDVRVRPLNLSRSRGLPP